MAGSEQKGFLLELGRRDLKHVQFALHVFMKIAMERYTAGPFGVDPDDQRLARVHVEPLHPFPIRHDLVVFSRDQEA
jgi:hypothetical protein